MVAGTHVVYYGCVAQVTLALSRCGALCGDPGDGSSSGHAVDLTTSAVGVALGTAATVMGVARAPSAHTLRVQAAAGRGGEGDGPAQGGPTSPTVLAEGGRGVAVVAVSPGDTSLAVPTATPTAPSRTPLNDEQPAVPAGPFPAQPSQPATPHPPPARGEHGGPSSPRALQAAGALQPGSESATRVHVAPAPLGVDGPSCGPAASPCATLRYAVDTIASAGQPPMAVIPITLAAGRYGGDSCGGIATRPLAVSGAGRDSTLVDCLGTDRLLGTTASLSLSGLTVVRGGVVVDPLRGQGLVGPVVGGGGLWVLLGPGDPGPVTLTNLAFFNCTVVGSVAPGGSSSGGGGGSSPGWVGGGGAVIIAGRGQVAVTVTDCLFVGNWVRLTDGSNGLTHCGGGLCVALDPSSPQAPIPGALTASLVRLSGVVAEGNRVASDSYGAALGGGVGIFVRAVGSVQGVAIGLTNVTATSNYVQGMASGKEGVGNPQLDVLPLLRDNPLHVPLGHVPFLWTVQGTEVAWPCLCPALTRTCKGQQLRCRASWPRITQLVRPAGWSWHSVCSSVPKPPAAQFVHVRCAGAPPSLYH
jgi:hypothetical protein